MKKKNNIKDLICFDDDSLEKSACIGKQQLTLNAVSKIKGRKTKNGKNFASYKCSFCGFYHLRGT